MSHIQFGWTLPLWSVPTDARDTSARETFLATIQRGFECILGHFDSAWCIDHLQFDTMSVLEGWTALTHFATRYPQLYFGHAVLSQSYRNPALLAKMAATLQYLSNGRFLLGIGAGWKEDEYRAYGYPFPSPGVRIAELTEALQIINALWREERVTLQGKHYQVHQAVCDPKPHPIPPIIIGGSQPRMLRLIARYADWWNVSQTGIDAYRDQVQACELACAEVGRDLATLRRTWYGYCQCVPTDSAAAMLSHAQGFVGTPAHIIAQMRPFIELGVDYFMLDCGGFPDLTTLDLLAREVLPALNGTSEKERLP